VKVQLGLRPFERRARNEIDSDERGTIVVGKRGYHCVHEGWVRDISNRRGVRQCLLYAILTERLRLGLQDWTTTKAPQPV
jgi:hypothetical protein